MNTHRTTRPFMGRDGKAAVYESQAATGPVEEDREAENAFHPEPSVAGGATDEQNRETGTPEVVGRTWCDLVYEFCRNERGIPAALAWLIRRISIIALLAIFAYNQGIHAKPSDPPMPYWALLIFLTLAPHLEVLLRRLIDRIIPEA